MSEEEKSTVVVVVLDSGKERQGEEQVAKEERGRMHDRAERVQAGVRHVSRSPNSRAPLFSSGKTPGERPEEKKEAEKPALKPSYITAMCETMSVAGLHPYSIRGHCSGEFFRKTVNAFYARHPEVVRAEPEARRFVDGQWCTMFSAGEKWTKYEQPDWPVLIPESERVEKNEKNYKVRLVIPKNAIPRK